MVRLILDTIPKFSFILCCLHNPSKCLAEIMKALPSGNSLRSYWSHGPVEIVDLSSYKTEICSIVFCKRLPEC